MSGSAAGRRYAEALLDTVWHEDESKRRSVVGELAGLADAIDEVFDLKNAIENPAYASAERAASLDAVTETLGLSNQVRTFARLVVERGRASELRDIVQTFNELLDERSNRIRATVTSATALDEADEQNIRKALERRTGKTVEMKVEVDPALIGGIRAEVGSTVFDGSLRAELDRLRGRLQES